MRTTGDNRGHLSEKLSSHSFGLGGQAAALVIVEAQSLWAQLLAQNSVLFSQVLDQLQLLLVHPAGYGDQQKPERVHGFRHEESNIIAGGARPSRQSLADLCRSIFRTLRGSQYRRLVASFQRIFGATIFFGTDSQSERAVVVHRARFNFMTEARIWYSRDPEQKLLPGDCQNRIVLSDEFYREIQAHPIPTDLEAARALSSSPAALDLFMWLCFRCFTARGKERVPLFGAFGLVSQLGSAEYARHRRFREKLESWLNLIRAMWPECPARIDDKGTGLFVDRATAVLTREVAHARS